MPYVWLRATKLYSHYTIFLAINWRFERISSSMHCGLQIGSKSHSGLCPMLHLATAGTQRITCKFSDFVTWILNDQNPTLCSQRMSGRSGDTAIGFYDAASQGRLSNFPSNSFRAVFHFLVFRFLIPLHREKRRTSGMP